MFMKSAILEKYFPLLSIRMEKLVIVDPGNMDWIGWIFQFTNVFEDIHLYSVY